MKKIMSNANGNIGFSDETQKKIAAEREARTIQSIPLSLIDVEANVRSSYDEQSIADLAESILKHGLLQPITLAENGARYIIKFGHRRYFATQRAGLEEIDAFVRPPYADSSSRATQQLIENIQREDLPAPDLEVAVNDMLKENGGDVAAVAKLLGKSASWVRYVTGAAVARADLPPAAQVEASTLSSKELYSMASQDPKNIVEAVGVAAAAKSGAASTNPDSAAPKPLLSLKVILTEEGVVQVKAKGVVISQEAQELIQRAVELIKRDMQSGKAI